MNLPTWVQDEVVRAIHLRQVSEHGGDAGIRDEGLLASALARPQNALAYSPECDLATLAAAYAFGIMQNHPFLDGNKRTAYVVGLTFLRLNGLTLEASSEEKYVTFLGVAEGRVSEEALARWIRGHVIRS